MRDKAYVFRSHLYRDYFFVGLLCLSLYCLISCQTTAIPLQTGIAQLFIDDYLIASQENLQRTLNQPAKDLSGTLPIIALEDEFEYPGSTLEANGTIVYDPVLKKYVMFALAFSPQGRTLNSEQRWKYYRIYRFTSEDGLSWLKGADGAPQWVYPRTKEDLFDPKSKTYATNIDHFSCYYDVDDEAFPYKAWQHFANWGEDREGQYYLRSKDGIYWERGQMVVNGYGGKDDPYYQTIYQDGRRLVGTGDVTHFYYDKIEDRFLGSFKFYSPEIVEYGNRLRSRIYAFFDHGLDQPFDIKQLDHIELLPPAKEENNDFPYDEYYSSNGWRYESLWLGGLKIWHGEGDYPWSAAGGGFMKLIVSRDGLSWSKVPFANNDGYPEIFIANGPEGGNNGKNDGGYMTDFTQGPLTINDELIFYYGCSSYGKNHPDSIRISGGGIFRARLRKDGFVSVDSGSLTTELLSFEGKNLYINAIGPITIKILDADDTVLGSQQVLGDALWHKIVISGKDIGEIAPNGKMKLRFNIGLNARLYSFSIID
jgi:hypothetical protein